MELKEAFYNNIIIIFSEYHYPFFHFFHFFQKNKLRGYLAYHIVSIWRPNSILNQSKQPIMDIFIAIKRILKLFGFLPINNPYEKVLTITINCICFCVVILNINILAFFWFSLFDAKTLLEHIQSFYMFVYVLSILFAFCVLLWQRKEILELINQFELKIQGRMWIRMHIYILENNKYLNTLLQVKSTR